MKICYLGAGVWGYCLAHLLASKGHHVSIWTTKDNLAHRLNGGQEHPHLPGHPALPNMHFTTKMGEALQGADVVIESVTSAGLRSVLKELHTHDFPPIPLVITSKGIEQNTGLILPDVAVEVLGDERKHLIGMLSGPSFASEVIQGLPTSVVAAAYATEDSKFICDLFTTPRFRVYPNSDLRGVAFGGALKNVIAIACGIAMGLQLGYSALAALMTRGLHEIRKLAIANGCDAATLNGLSGMGDLCLTCSSLISRNCRFGYMLAQGKTPQEAREQIGMVVEGAYTCISALQLAQQMQLPTPPITEAVHHILYEKWGVEEALQRLMQREVKEEHL